MAQRSLSAVPTPAIIDELARRRASLMAQIAELDAILGGATGQGRAYAARGTGSGYRTSPRVPPKQGSGNAMTLSDAIAMVIGTGRKTVAEIVAGIMRTGFKSSSKDLHKLVGVHLAQHRKQFRRVGRGVYAVKK